PSPVTGTLTSIVVSEGETVPMGTVIAEIAVAGEDPGDVSPQHLGTSAGPMAPTPSAPDRIGTLLKDVAPVGPTGSGGAISMDLPESATTPPQHDYIVPTSPPVRPPAAPPQRPPSAGRYSPAVQRLAGEHGVDLSKVSGTGIGGRVTRQDVEQFVQRGAGKPAAAPVPVSEGDERVPVTPVRRSIAEHMVKSATQIPHVWSLVEVDVSGLVARREAVKDEFQKREGVGITYLAFVLKAVAGSLTEHRLLNASWGDDHIVLKKRVNIGVAVAATSGLVVPVVRDADAKSITQIARELDGLTERARSGRLALQDVQGGTFTVNNTGALGSVASQPLINHPQSAILTTEAIVRRPVADGDEVTIRPIMNMVLGFDHRVMDGREAGAFLQAVKQRLETIGLETAL
ncbi:MAG: 2-oxo acid dehydrogenase subunit E2, partial [SAR202 cluster bacterium]|nr:2-oxo acid dehydrogenase subunit E2 [SAR202 cluster bacterium]